VKEQPLLIKEGYLRKKGIIFNNKRLLRLHSDGRFEYYDPNNLEIPRGTF
jgi:hypothetical protein